MKARFNGICKLCGDPINIGDELTRAEVGGLTLFVHKVDNGTCKPKHVCIGCGKRGPWEFDKEAFGYVCNKCKGVKDG